MIMIQERAIRKPKWKFDRMTNESVEASACRPLIWLISYITVEKVATRAATVEKEKKSPNFASIRL